MKKLLLTLIVSSVLILPVSAQLDTVNIHTSAVCSTCKRTLEKDLSFEKGVKTSKLDLTTFDIMVVYDPKKTTPDKIRQRIAHIGYDADDVKRDPKGFDRLPDCCKQEDGHH